MIVVKYMEELLKAVQNGKLWIDQFNRVSYKKAFDHYKEVFGWIFINAVNKADSLDSLAKGFVDAIEAGWSKKLFFNRGGAKVDDKLMLTFYLTPMLLSLDNEKCSNFAEKINKAWSEKFPKESFTIADYETIANGFTNTIMGIDMDKKR